MDGTEDDVLWQDIAEQAAADEENDMDEDLLCNDTDLMPLEKVHQLLLEKNDDDDDDKFESVHEYSNILGLYLSVFCTTVFSLFV